MNRPVCKYNNNNNNTTAKMNSLHVAGKAVFRMSEHYSRGQILVIELSVGSHKIVESPCEQHVQRKIGKSLTCLVL